MALPSRTGSWCHLTISTRPRPSALSRPRTRSRQPTELAAAAESQLLRSPTLVAIRSSQCSSLVLRNTRPQPHVWPRPWDNLLITVRTVQMRSFLFGAARLQPPAYQQHWGAIYVGPCRCSHGTRLLWSSRPPASSTNNSPRQECPMARRKQKSWYVGPQPYHLPLACSSDYCFWQFPILQEC